ncbi:hypothetical protein RRSWK_00577 [Rhodopirellula sp. SWK7]|nr:hypothetical protein RRSWK_00577 [Rhodopirellula sp. SWK7]
MGRLLTAAMTLVFASVTDAKRCSRQRIQHASNGTSYQSRRSKLYGSTGLAADF